MEIIQSHPPLIDRRFESNPAFEMVMKVLSSILDAPDSLVTSDSIIGLLDQITDKSILKNLCPSLTFMIIELNSPNVKYAPKIAILKRLLYEFNYDINSSQPLGGSILHIFCRYHGYQGQLCEFLTQLKNDNYFIDFERKAFIDLSHKAWFTTLLHHSGKFTFTPLEYAIETRCFMLARHFIFLGASVDHLVFSESFLSNCVEYWDRRDHYELVKALLYLNVFTLDQVTRGTNLTSKRKFQLKQFIISRSLFELCMRVIRKYPQQSTGSKSIYSFVENYQDELYLPQLTSYLTLSEL